MRYLVLSAWLCLALLAGCASAVSSGYGQGGRTADGRSYQAARADNRLVAEVTAALVRDPTVPAMRIRVQVRGGLVTLEGIVPGDHISARAERLAASVAGVVGVENRLRIGR